MVSPTMEAAMLRAILSALMGILGMLFYPFYIFGSAIMKSCEALGYLPSVPPADGTDELEEIAAEEAVVKSAEDLNSVKQWASAKLFGRSFDLPVGRIGEWLRVLTVDDAALIAVANGGGVLAEHITGQRLFPGLAPVGSAERTRRWCFDHRPTPVRREAPKATQPALSTETDDLDHDCPLRFVA
jgi:hypothetical protein